MSKNDFLKGIEQAFVENLFLRLAQINSLSYFDCSILIDLIAKKSADLQLYM